MLTIGKLYTTISDKVRCPTGGFLIDLEGRPFFRKEANGDLGHYLTRSEYLENNSQMNLLFLGTISVHDCFWPGDGQRRFYRFLWKDEIVLLDEDKIKFICPFTP